MEKKEVAVYLYLGVLIVASLLAVYYFNLSLTGFAVSSNLSLGEGNNVEYNGSALVLMENQTSGDYISEIFGNGSNVTWNNLTWQGNVLENSSLSFEVSDCLESNCSDASFGSVESVNNTLDLSGLNLTGKYLQYKIVFGRNNKSDQSPFIESVSLDYSVPVPAQPETLTITISNPSGEKESATAVPMQFTLSGGADYTCWYNIRDASDDALITQEIVSLSGCNNNSTFDLGVGDGSYTFTLFVNSSLGLYNKTSSFSVNLGSSDEEEEEEVESTIQVPVITQTRELSLQNIETSTINPSDSRNYNLIATNTGDVSLTACVLSAGGDFASWLSISGDSQNINAGEGKNFAFSVNVPEDAGEGIYAFPLTVQCAEITRNSEFSVEAIKKRVEFNITDVERTRSDRVVVSYSLQELLEEEQTVELQFFLYDASNAEVANASANQSLLAGESDDFSTNIAINESLEENAILTLTANLNSQQYSVSVREPITLGAPTGFFVLGDDLGTTGNVLAIIILIVGGVAVFFFLKRKNISKKIAGQ